MKDYVLPFNQDIGALPLPEKFTFPFYYDPHPLSLVAAQELQTYLSAQKEWEHNFGMSSGDNGFSIGKMFGVLVVQRPNGALGYICAVSGKLANRNIHSRFVPPIFDMLTEGGYFNNGMKELTVISQQIDQLSEAPELALARAELVQGKLQGAAEIEEEKRAYKAGKKQRKAMRVAAEQKLSAVAFQELVEELRQESIASNFRLRDLIRDWEQKWKDQALALEKVLAPITALKAARKDKSNGLQKWLFDQYQFLNVHGEEKGVSEIFAPTVHKVPPSGAGECAAPKLLQYAFKNNLKPIALAEFWWGKSPKSEIRKHKHFYPACKGKCEPILGHMLVGTETDPNPMLINPAEGKAIEIVYEDDALAVINKPADFLSVPGKNISDSVAERMKIRYPKATGPLVVHRLDMSTSGLMLIAKSSEVHKALQHQFIERTISKRYVAMLDGVLKEEEGMVELPIRLDFNDRPRQLVCYEHGKPARTKYKVIDRTEVTTKVHFFPITGRTHQLRMHAAHASGLNLPIVGDDLYGTKGSRLHLHAELLTFWHPIKKKKFTVQADAPF